MKGKFICLWWTSFIYMLNAYSLRKHELVTEHKHIKWWFHRHYLVVLQFWIFCISFFFFQLIRFVAFYIWLKTPSGTVGIAGSRTGRTNSSKLIATKVDRDHELAKLIYVHIRNEFINLLEKASWINQSLTDFLKTKVSWIDLFKWTVEFP